MTPSPPQGMPRQRAPSAPAASSTSATSGGTALCSSSQSTGRPNRWTARTAFVRGVTARSTASASASIVSGRRRRAPAVRRRARRRSRSPGTCSAGTITSSPGPIPSASTARWSAAVPDETATACSRPQARAISASNSLDLRAHRQVPDSENLATAAAISPRRRRAGEPDGCRVSHCARAELGTRRSSARAPRRARPSPRSRAARAPCRRSGCAARRRCSGAARRRSRRGSRQIRLIRCARS